MQLYAYMAKLDTAMYLWWVRRGINVWQAVDQKPDYYLEWP